MAKSKLTISPLYDRVVVLPESTEKVRSSGIVIPDSSKERPQKGVVVAVGPGKKDEPMSVKIGDLVIYGKYGGTEYLHEGTEYLILKESDIFAKL